MSVHQAPPPTARQTPRPPALSLTVSAEGAVAVVVRVRGAVDMATSDLLLDAVETVLAGRPPPVLVLDLSGVTFFSAAGITALLVVRQHVAAAGRTLVLRQPSRITAVVIDIVELRDEFTIE
ncbi:anti-anti-sigma factor [Micromonospora nigra]|uniref:Anti-anti-sigma factor n=1 Tax=Micromonospora nigra TaxID=145857 RepID=A0A1C6RA87_9ACTN|nr:STAS domain-containing protein [Micromonospora nigra]SCL14006.1 anti-anti-sigma factor [Micromonospora nigra]